MPVIGQDTLLPRVLFIRGGQGTGGFLEGWGDDQLSSIDDYSTANKNRGWGQFADILKNDGFVLEQKIEGPKSNNSPVDLINIDLRTYQLIVFGSNNATYPIQAVDSLEEYVKKGGAALFISDANWGSDWHVAPNSDQPFLDRFGWVMNQDQGTYSISSSEFKIADHPIFEKVSAFDGEGVSPITLANDQVDGVQSTILAPAKSIVRRNTVTGKGPSEFPNSMDASLIVATVGEGRIAGHFDRNTFFNTNGAGSNIHNYSNKQYAINLYRWLTNYSGSTVSVRDTYISESPSVYPNPSRDHIFIESQNTIRGIEILNLNGTILHAQKGVISQSIMSIDLPQELKPGIYFVRIYTDRSVKTYKLIRE